MKPFTSKHCTQYLTKSSPLNQRKKVKSLAEKEYEQDLRREKRMPGFAEKPEGGIQKEANKNRSKAKRKISNPTAPKPTPLNQGKKIIGEQTYELKPDKASGNYVAGLSLDGGSAEPEFTKNRLVITPSQYNSLVSRSKISSGFVGGDFIEQDHPMNIKKDSVSGGKNYYSIKSNRESFKKKGSGASAKTRKNLNSNKYRK